MQLNCDCTAHHRCPFSRIDNKLNPGFRCFDSMWVANNICNNPYWMHKSNKIYCNDIEIAYVCCTLRVACTTCPLPDEKCNFGSNLTLNMLMCIFTLSTLVLTATGLLCRREEGCARRMRNAQIGLETRAIRKISTSFTTVVLSTWNDNCHEVIFLASNIITSHMRMTASIYHIYVVYLSNCSRMVII